MLETIVLSPESEYPDESEWVVKLFEAGLSRYHVRKPGMNDDEVEAYIQRIPETWRKQVIPHQCYRLVNTLQLGGWHFKDDLPQLRQADRLRKSRSDDQLLSRSIHSLDDLNEGLSGWDYVFLSPVFQSISKHDYGARWKESQIKLALQYCKEKCDTRVFALGGVDVSKVSQCVDMGFDGVALLGAVWQSDHPLESFRKVRKALISPKHK